MKRLKTFLLLLLVAFCPGWTSPAHVNLNATDNNGVLLVYIGEMGAMGVDIAVEIDSTVGARYDVVFQNGDNVLSHIAVFYKFSAPNQTIFYNYLSHQSVTHNCCESASSGSNVKAAGTGVIDNYSCTHVQNVNNNERNATDYWVSTQVPGYSLLLKILNSIGPGYQQLFVDGNIFQWGGLVRMTSTSHGRTVGSIDLTEANPAMSFPAKDFDVPSN